MPTQYCIAFWNLENLFDVEDSPRRTEKVQRVVGQDIKGWTQDLLTKKIAQLASIISQMNDNQGPDLLGICEAENRYVIDLLVKALAPLKRKYKVAHFDTKDQRGIDVAFIYDSAKLTAKEKFSHFVVKRSATRDILQVNFTTTRQRTLVMLCNHWPSRLGEDTTKSDSYRAMAGETLAYFHERIMEILGDAAPVIAMGDFNDEPFNASLVDYALSERIPVRVARAKNASFLNMMWPLLSKNEGTYYYGSEAMIFDQFLANKNLFLADSPLKVVSDSVKVVRCPEMIKDSIYPGPIPFGGMGKDVNEKGFSDHFPVQMLISEAD